MKENENELSLDEVEELFASDELSLEEVEELLALPEPEPTRRRRKDPTDDRSIKGWFNLIHKFDHECQVALHDDARPRNKGAHILIGNTWVCRECYMAELDKLDE